MKMFLSLPDKAIIYTIPDIVYSVNTIYDVINTMYCHQLHFIVLDNKHAIYIYNIYIYIYIYIYINYLTKS